MSPLTWSHFTFRRSLPQPGPHGRLLPPGGGRPRPRGRRQPPQLTPRLLPRPGRPRPNWERPSAASKRGHESGLFTSSVPPPAFLQPENPRRTRILLFSLPVSSWLFEDVSVLHRTQLPRLRGPPGPRPLRRPARPAPCKGPPRGRPSPLPRPRPCLIRPPRWPPARPWRPVRRRLPQGAPPLTAGGRTTTGREGS